MGSTSSQPATGRSMSHRFAQGVLYVRHRERTPTDADWEAMLVDVTRSLQASSALKILVRTDSGGPNVLQRSRLNEVVAASGGKVHVAVLSSSVLVRGIITAFSWMRTVQVRSFPPGAYDAALAYLEVKIKADAAERVIGEIEAAVA